MPRGYRCILVALVGWLSLAASPPKDAAANPQTGTNHEVASALNNLASALKQPEKPTKHDEPCDPGDNNRSSDLCAQWKAADAAKSAAQAAWWIGIVGSVIGAFTLVAAIAAARWAKKAAVETERSAEAAEKAVTETQRIGEAQTRAYLSVSKCTVTYYDGKPCIRPTISNSGQSPALNVNWTATIAHFILDAKKLRDSEMNGEYELFECDIPAHGAHAMLPSVSSEFGLDADELACLQAGKQFAIQALVRARGNDVFGGRISADANFIIILRKAPTHGVAIELDRGSILREADKEGENKQ